MPNILTTSQSVPPTLLSENITDASTIIIVADASDFAASGVASIKNTNLLSEAEIITYSGKTSRTLTGVTRGTNGSAALAFRTGAVINQLDWTPVIDEADTVATTDDVAGRNLTIEYQDEGIPVAAKGGIEYVDFVGLGITATEFSAGHLTVEVTGFLDTRASDPGSPSVGQMWLRTDL